MHFQAVRMIDFHSEVLYSNMGTNALTIILIDMGLAQGAVQMIVEGGIHGDPISFNIGYMPVIPNVVCMLFPMLLPYGIHPCPCGGMVDYYIVPNSKGGGVFHLKGEGAHLYKIRDYIGLGPRNATCPLGVGAAPCKDHRPFSRGIALGQDDGVAALVRSVPTAS